jgi:hypothetical protein
MKSKPAVHIRPRKGVYYVTCGKNFAMSTILDRAIVMALTGRLDRPEPKSLAEYLQRENRDG